MRVFAPLTPLPYSKNGAFFLYAVSCQSVTGSRNLRPLAQGMNWLAGVGTTCYPFECHGRLGSGSE